MAYLFNEIRNQMYKTKIDEISILPFLTIIIFYLTSLNIGLLIEIRDPKLSYIPVLAAMALAILYNFKYIKIKKNFWSIMLIISLFLSLIRFNVPFFGKSIVFTLIFGVHLVFLLLANKTAVPRKILITLLDFCLAITLTATILDLFIGPGKKGWIWPVNIALQEIVIIGLLYARIILKGIKRNIIFLALFIAILLIRESGKAALLAMIIGLYFIRPTHSNENRIKFQLKIFKFVFVGQLILAFLAKAAAFHLDSLAPDNVLKYIFSKRVFLINDGINFLISDPFYFIFGAGLDINNYLSLNEVMTIRNAPQLFFLTTGVMGGVIFIIPLLKNLFMLLKSKMEHIASKQKVVLASYFISISIMSSFHEYLNNPFIIFSISIVLISYNTHERERTFIDNHSSI